MTTQDMTISCLLVWGAINVIFLACRVMVAIERQIKIEHATEQIKKGQKPILVRSVREEPSDEGA